MRIGLCVTGFTRILQILQEVLPDDDVFELSRAEVVQMARDVDVLIPTVAPIPAETFTGPRIKLIQQYGVGLDSVDIPAATKAGVLVANIPSARKGNAESVAELAIAHMLMLSRHMPLALQRFQEKRVGSPLGNCIWESTVVILGYGGIGQEVARRLAGFGIKIIVVSRNGPFAERERDSSIHVDKHVATDALHEVLAEADYLVVTVPASPENIGLVGKSALEHIKAGAYIVNIARGPVVDYHALLNALRDGRVAGAGIDVFWREPFDPEDPLLKLNVIPTPHIGGSTERSLTGIGQAVASNIEMLKRGELPSNCANPEAYGSRQRS